MPAVEVFVLFPPFGFKLSFSRGPSPEALHENDSISRKDVLLAIFFWKIFPADALTTHLAARKRTFLRDKSKDVQ